MEFLILKMESVPVFKGLGIYSYKIIELSLKSVTLICFCFVFLSGGDQGLLNMFFSSWATTDIRKHLPFIYNLSSISIYSYLPAFKA